MGKDKIKTHASKEAMRYNDEESVIQRGPAEDGTNDFDIRMSGEPDGVLAAKKIVDCIKKTGLCVIEANAPRDLLAAAADEANQLWEDGSFQPPLKVHDDRSMLEAKAWRQALQDEEKIVWIRPPKQGDEAGQVNCPALRVLASNLSEFGSGLGQLIEKETGASFDRHGHSLLSCYTGDRQYALHVDNPHGNDDDDDDEDGPIDNGLRITAVYFLNLDPESDAGGLDVYLTDPKETPSSSSAAKSAPKFRVNGKADTLVFFRSETMAHQVIQTKGKAKYFCLSMWYINGKAQNEMGKKLVNAFNRKNKEEKDDSDVD